MSEYVSGWCGQGWNYRMVKGVTREGSAVLLESAKQFSETAKHILKKSKRRS